MASSAAGATTNRRPATSTARRRLRPRTRTAAATAAAAASVLLLGTPSGSGMLSAEAFVVPSAPSPGMRHIVQSPVHASSFGKTGTSSPSSAGAHHANSQTTLLMASSSDSLRSSTYPHLPSPPTPDEEVDLLTLAVEYLRLRNLDRDLALSSPNLQPPRLSLRAEAAGYGEDVEAYQVALEDGQRARDELITRNMALVHHVVTSIVGPDTRWTSRQSGHKSNASMQKSKKSIQPQVQLNSLSREDLIQEGALGLSRAIDRYDPTGTNGARFATHAVYWIRAAVYRCIAERDDLVRVPVYVSEGVRKLTKAARQLGIDLDEEAALGVVGRQSKRGAWKEAERARMLAEEAGLSDRQLAEAVRVRRRRQGGGYTSLESLDGGWQDILMGRAVGRGKASAAAVTSTAATTSSPAVGSSATAVTPSGHTTDDVAEIRRVLSKHLKPKELEALSWRYGLKTASDDATATASTSTATTTAQTATETRATPARDYEEEALEELFGKEGILASYSADPLPSTARAIQSERSAKEAKNKKMGRRPKAPVVISNSSAQRGRWGEAMSFAEVGRNMAVSAEYGRRLCGQALKKLQVAADEGRLEFQPDWLSV